MAPVAAREPMLAAEARGPEATEQRPSASVLALFRYATPTDRIILVCAVLGAMVQGTMSPMMSFFMKDLFQAIFLPNDNGSLPPDASGSSHRRDEQVLKSLYIFVALAAIAFVSTAIGQIGFSYVAEKMSLELKKRFFDRLLRRDVGWFDVHGTAEMATRLTNDSYDFRQGVGEKLALLIMGVTMSPIGFVVAFVHDWRLTLMMLVAIPFMGIAIGMAMRTVEKMSKSAQGNYSKAGGIAEASISSIRTVAAFGGYEREVAKYDQHLAVAYRSGVRSGWIMGGTLGLTQLVVYSTCSLGFFAGSILVVRDYKADCWKSEPPFGTCFTGATMLSTLFAVIYSASGLAQAPTGLAVLASAKSAAARIYEVIDEPLLFDADVGETLPKVEGQVEFKDVTLRYPTRPDVPALMRVSFTVPAGKTAAFVGPSGSGKSTVVSLLQRFYDPSEGSIHIDGHDVRSLKMSWLRSKMALVQQEPVLFSGTIQENIAYGSVEPVSREAVEVAAAASNAHRFISAFPSKYKTEVGERGVQLSGGQKQRIAIARAIIRDPAILLLDEATSALDTESERVVQEALDSLLAQKARTTFVVAHRLSTIRNAHQILVLENGHLLETGTHQELVAKPGSLYAQLVKLQDLTSESGAEQQRPSGNATGNTNVGPAALEMTPLQRQKRENQTQGLARQDSGGEAAVQEVLAADDADVNVPSIRLWSMHAQDTAFVLLGLVSTIPLGAGRPLLGVLFSRASNLFSQPAARRMPDGSWLGNLDVDELTDEAHTICLEFAMLGAFLMMTTWGQLGGFRRASESLTRRIRLQTFQAMLRQEIGYFDARTTGHLVDRLASDAPLIKTFTGDSLAGLLQFVFCVSSGLGLALWASWRLTLSALVFVPLLMTATRAHIRAFKRVNETAAGPMVSEVMGHIKTVASFHLREQMLARYEALLVKEGKEERRKSLSIGVLTSYTSAITFLMVGGVVFVANVFISQRWIKPDDVLQVLFTVMFASQGAAQASQWSTDKAKARKALNHIFCTLDRTPEIDAYAESGEQLEKVRGEVEFRHVAFRYATRPDVVVFEDLDLKVEAGKTVALCGPSGSGKSTTIALLQRFYDPTSGTVCLDGRDVRSLNLAWLRQQMALVQQEPVLFAGSVTSNIAYGREGASQQECEAAAKASNAHGFISDFPDGYETDVGERGGQLSGGQKQRIAIARAMVRDPAVLLLDEATSALDTESERVVQDALDTLLAQSCRTTIVIAHRLSTIVNSDIICVIYQGKIVEKGSHNDLMAINGGHYKQLAARQQTAA